MDFMSFFSTFFSRLCFLKVSEEHMNVAKMETTTQMGHGCQRVNVTSWHFVFFRTHDVYLSVTHTHSVRIRDWNEFVTMTEMYVLYMAQSGPNWWAFGKREKSIWCPFFFFLELLFTLSIWHWDAAMPEFMTPSCHHSYADDTRHPH